MQRTTSLISAPARRRGCPAGRLAERESGNLSVSADTHHCWLCCRRRARYLARLIGQWLSVASARPFVIENRPGASTNIAIEKSPTRRPMATRFFWYLAMRRRSTATLYDKLNFNFIRDIAPVAGHQPRARISCWSIRRCPAKRLLSSLSMPRPIREKSIWPLRALAAGRTWRASCSSAWPASTWSHVAYRGGAAGNQRPDRRTGAGLFRHSGRSIEVYQDRQVAGAWR